MTYEEKAEEYVDDNFYDLIEEVQEIAKIAFKDGAKFGYNKCDEQLIKSKELLEKLLEEEKNNMYWEMNGSDNSSYYEVKKQAEQFLNSEVEK